MANRRGPLSLTVELTTSCNQKCWYCYNTFDHSDVRALPTGTLLTLIERALSEVPFFRLDFSGGEPFASETLAPAVELCYARGAEASVITNATMANPEVLARLAQFPTCVFQVTLNGPNAEVHDTSVGVRGAWERALRGIDMIHRHGLMVTGSMVLTHRNAALVGQTLDRMRSIGIRSAALMRLMPGGISARSPELLPTRSDILEALRQASDARFADLALRMGGPFPPCVADHRDFPTIRFGWCSIGASDQNFVLGTDGCLRNCPHLAQPIGDARHHSFADLVRAPSVRDYRRRVPDFCRGCSELPRCIGGCGAAALAMTGDIHALDPLVLQHTDPVFARRVRAARQQSQAQ